MQKFTFNIQQTVFNGATGYEYLWKNATNESEFEAALALETKLAREWVLRSIKKTESNKFPFSSYEAFKAETLKKMAIAEKSQTAAARAAYKAAHAVS